MAYKRDVFRTIQRTLPFLFLTVLLVLANGQSVRVNRLAPQTPSADARRMLISRPSKMPEKSTVAISAIRYLQGDQFLRDLEIEVQNNSGRPIYHLEIDLTFPELTITREDGKLSTLIIPIMFGRQELMNPGEFAASTERAIQPAERYTFKIPELYLKGMELHLTRNNIPVSAITKVQLRIYELSFGDGTGFEMGEPFSNKQSLLQEAPRKGIKAYYRKARASPKNPGARGVNYAPIKSASTSTSSSISPQLSCGEQFSGCQLYERVLEKCPYLATGPCAL